MNPLKLRDQWGYYETNKNAWIRLRASVSEETKTAHKISSRNSTLVHYQFYLILTVSIFQKKNYFAKQTQKKNAKCIIFYNNDKCFLVLVINMFMFWIKKKWNNKERLKKSQLAKFL